MTYDYHNIEVVVQSKFLVKKYKFELYLLLLHL
jgi:hypothetical protein